MIRARFAPSPTGDLHVGSASTALASWVLAARVSGTNILRIEDIDTPRVVRGASERIVDDLLWLGLSWEEGPGVSGDVGEYMQSARMSMYHTAIDELSRRGLVYPCDCSRAEISALARAQASRGDASSDASEASAPHGEELVYPGTCRHASPDRAFKRPPALRLRVPDDASVTFTDGTFGEITEHVLSRCGDFVLRRGDGLIAYHLAVSVDDVAMRITDVVRGADLLSSTARQILLMNLLGAKTLPRYTHVPLVLAADGARLAKRDKSVIVRELRASGVRADEIIGVLAHGLGLASDSAPIAAKELARNLHAAMPAFARAPFRYFLAAK